MEPTSTVRQIDVTALRLEELTRVRAGIRRLTAATDVPTYDAVLAANELATNALLYAGRCHLRAWIHALGGALRVEVADPLPPPLPTVTLAGPSAVGGRGLSIVNQLVTRWGVDAAPPTGKTVWFEIEPCV